MKLFSDVTSIIPDHGAWNQITVFPPVFGQAGSFVDCHGVMLPEWKHAYNASQRSFSSDGSMEQHTAITESDCPFS
jgi:hypothetical protein